MIKFDNKLELRYYFNDKSNYMDAMIKHRSEKEVLSLVRTLADMLDIKMTVYCESFAQQEGFREIWSVAGENSRLISVRWTWALRSVRLVPRRRICAWIRV